MTKFICDNKEYDSIQDYYNSDNLDPDLVYLYIWREVRVPQNEKEKKWKTESDRMKERGESFEISFN